jgi:hypothetical protein
MSFLVGSGLKLSLSALFGDVFLKELITSLTGIESSVLDPDSLSPYPDAAF